MDQCISLRRVLQRGEGRSDQVHLLIIIRRNKLKQQFSTASKSARSRRSDSGDGATESEPEKNIAASCQDSPFSSLLYLSSLSNLLSTIWTAWNGTGTELLYLFE